MPRRNSSTTCVAVRVGRQPSSTRARVQSISGSRSTASNRCGEAGSSRSPHAAATAYRAAARGSRTRRVPNISPSSSTSTVGSAARLYGPRASPDSTASR